MMHLSAEQFEEAMATPGAHSEHLAACARCREALEGLRALRERLRAAHEGVHAPAGLAERVLAAAIGPQQRAGQAPPLIRRVARFPGLWKYGALAAAAALLLAAGLTMQVWPADALAAQTELAAIHQQNVSAVAKGGSNMLCGDMKQMQEFVKNKTGCSPLSPCCGAGTSVDCCCVQKFRGKPVGSFVLKTPRGPVSVVVMPDTVDSLGMKKSLQVDGRPYKCGSVDGSNMIAATVGQYTYCAVGNVDTEQLSDVMAQLMKSR